MRSRQQHKTREMREIAHQDSFRDGVEQFNRGDFFEAHEVWETLWKPARNENRELLQGLIQAAAGLLHVSRGNLSGAASLYAKSIARLSPLGDQYGGIELGRFRCELGEYFASVATGAIPPRTPAIRFCAEQARRGV
jgi:uncharacterized protein